MVRRNKKRCARKSRYLQNDESILSAVSSQQPSPHEVSELGSSYDRQLENENKNSDISTQQEVDSIPVLTSPKNKIDRLEILEKTIAVMRSNSDRNQFNHILQCIFNILDASQQKRESCCALINSFTDGIDSFDHRELPVVQKKLADILYPKSLLDIVTDEKNVVSTNFVGQGGFGNIFKGELFQDSGSALKVVIKSSRRKERETFLLREAIIMTRLKHKNIMGILGFVKDPMQILIEDMELGDLSKCLKRIEIPLTGLFQMLIDVLTGMEYFAENLYIHRDLAARNIFVNRKLQCKIGDFGLSCHIDEPDAVYEEKSDCKRMDNAAPEVKMNGRFSIKSDVWAMGLLIWEAFYLNESCYLFGVPIALILENFMFANELPFPDTCPHSLKIYTLLKIMHPNPSRRPTFTDIKKFVTSFL